MQCSNPKCLLDLTSSSQKKYCSRACAITVNNSLFPKKSKLTSDEVFIKGSKVSNNTVKARLRELNLEFKCKECGVGEEWNGKPLSLQLEHVNGLSTDNRIENLVLLCPNCHSQTETFSGRNKKYK